MLLGGSTGREREAVVVAVAVAVAVGIEEVRELLGVLQGEQGARGLFAGVGLAPEHGTARHSTAQHSTAQHSTAQHSTDDRAVLA